MEARRLQLLTQNLSDDLRQYQRLSVNVMEAQSLTMASEPTMFELRAAAGILHDVYNGAEKMLERIMKGTGEKRPQGEFWHQQLLLQMTYELPERPAILSNATVLLLEEYRKFRHLARHLYGFELEWPKMRVLLTNAPPVMNAVTMDIQQFLIVINQITPPNA